MMHVGVDGIRYGEKVERARNDTVETITISQEREILSNFQLHHGRFRDSKGRKQLS